MVVATLQRFVLKTYTEELLSQIDLSLWGKNNNPNATQIRFIGETLQNKAQKN